MCLFALLAGRVPARRVRDLLDRAARRRSSAVFGGTFLWPLLGLIFLPFTTLMYVILWSPGDRASTGRDWLWVGIALRVVDVGHYGASAYGNRDQLPGMGSTQ